MIEEVSPLYCGEEEFDLFVDKSSDIVDGYVGFYWGKTIKEYSQPNVGIAGAIMRNWLEYFRTKGPEILKYDSRETQPIAPAEAEEPHR